MRIVLYLCVFVGLISWAGCGGNSDIVDRFCDANCNKLDECGSLAGVTLESCISNCKSGGQQNIGNSCPVTSAAIDACLAAIKAADCPLQTPPACLNLCGGQKPDGGSPTDGAGGDSSGVDNSGGTDTGGGGSLCGAIQGSCVQRDRGKTQCFEYSGQIAGVLQGLMKKCQEDEKTSWSSSPCNVSAPGMNFGCEIKTAACITSYSQLDAQQKAAASQGCTMGGGKVVNP